jgi:signal transduction histidine kinase
VVRASKTGQRNTEGAPAESPSGYPLAFLLLLAVCVAGMLVVTPEGVRLAAQMPLEAVAWVVFLGATNLLSLPALPRGDLEVSVGAPVAIATVVLLPPPLVALINCLGFTNEREFRGAAPFAMSVFNRCQMGLSAGAAGWAVGQLQLHPIAAAAVAVVVYNLANTGFVTAALWTRGKLGLGTAAKRSTMPFPRFAVDFGLVTLLALFIVVAYDGIGPWAVVLVALPLWLGFSALKSAREAEDRAGELADRVRELETLNAAAIEFLTARQVEQAAAVAHEALGRALDTDEIEVGVDGALDRAELDAIPVPGAEPAVVGVPAGLSERSLAVVEAIAGLLGMSLVRQRLERDLAEVQRARAALSGRILEEGTRERSRIALEIHDDVLPSLAAAQIQADNVRSALAAGVYDRADKIALATHDAAQDGIVRLRRVLDDLHRQILVPGALRPGLAAALEEVKVEHGLEVKLHAPDDLGDLPLAVEILVLDTVRGCLANVVRHAAASIVEIRLEVTERAIQVEVRDDGVGFDPSAIGEGHHGLVLMAQRVELARGQFAVTSAPGEGTQVRIEVPV